jgi:hypothetical protein
MMLSPGTGVVVGALPHRHGGGCRPFRELIGGFVIATKLGDQSLHHVTRGDVPLAHCRVERRHVGVAKFAGESRHRFGIHQALQWKSAAAHLAGDRVLA